MKKSFWRYTLARNELCSIIFGDIL